MTMNRTKVSKFSIALLFSVILGMAVYIPAKDLNTELARARAATAKYHDLTQAELDGYVSDMCSPGEGCHWFNWDYYLDGTFDPERPDALIYKENPTGGWQLVAVEYIMPTNGTCPSDPPIPAPEGFTGDEDDEGWRYCTEGYPDWELTAWIWFPNPNGMFAMENPWLEE